MYKIFIEILKEIKPIDIRQTVSKSDGVAEDVTLKDKHFVITTVEVLKQTANKLGYDFCSYNNMILFYNGCYWQQVADAEIIQLLRATAKRIGVHKYTAEYHSFADSLLKQFYVSVTLQKNENTDNEIKINLRNGTFVFNQNGELKAFNKADFLTYQLPFSFDSNANAPLFNNYLNRVLPDKDCQRVLAEYIGYVFTKGHQQQKCLLLYGGGANGKSVFFDIVRALLGKENLTTYSLHELGNPNVRAQINNKLLNYSSELDAGINNDTFKQLVSGEPLQAKLLYKDVFIIDNYAKLMFNCNELPKAVEYNNGFFRRWLIIPFTQTIPEKEQDKNLSSKIIANELPGIFNWVLSGLDRLIHQGCFTECELVNNTIKEFKQDSDSVHLFINHYNYVPSEKCAGRLITIYNEYKRFCMENGFKLLNISNFHKRLEYNGIAVKRANYGNCICMKEAKSYDSAKMDVDENDDFPFPDTEDNNNGDENGKYPWE